MKSLICEGFKSFKEKIKINFSKGFTSIVGANGSGKSNILDAFVFAIGELSGNKLRVNNIKDLICNGGSNGGTLSKSARVDVVFDNSDRKIPVDANIVKISRVINSDGKGKYYLNDKVTTRRELQDIMDLAGLIPNSTNLIMQGELFRIINMNNNERRGLIEDIAGIASYELKKEKAEKDLEKVEEDISRITLLLNELSIQIDSLEKEKNDALKYQEYDKKQKDAEKSQVILKLRGFDKQIKKIVNKKEALEREIEDINDNIVKDRVNLMEITSELGLINQEIKKLQTNELKELTERLNKLKTNFTKKEAKKENLGDVISKLKKNLIESFEKKEDIEQKRGDIQNNLYNKKEEKNVIKEKLRSFKEELYHSEEQIREFDSSYRDFQEKLESIKDGIGVKNTVRAEILSEIKLLENKLESTTNVLNNSQSRLEILNIEIEELTQKINTLEDQEKSCNENSINKLNLDDLEDKKRNLEVSLRKTEVKFTEKYEKLISLKSKIKVIQKLTSNKALEAVLRLKNDEELKSKHEISGTIYDTIAQLGKTKDEYNVALQTAGGNKFNYIVVDNQLTAKKCIEFLKINKIGRASFIPLDKINLNSINYDLQKNQEVIGRAVDLIQFDPMFKKAFEFVFGRTIIVSDLDVAAKLDLKARKVTLKGDIIETSNLMTGGAFKQSLKGGFTTHEESKMSTLESELSYLGGEKDSFLSEIKEIEKQIALSYRNRISTNNELSEIRQTLAVLKDNFLRKEEELGDYTSNIQKFESEVKDLEITLQEEQSKLDDIDIIIGDLTDKENNLKSKLSLIENNDFTQKINNLKAEIDNLEKENMKSKLEITKLNTQLDEIIKNRESEIEKSIKNYQEEIKTTSTELDALNKELNCSEKEINELESELSQKNEVVGQYYSRKEELQSSQIKVKTKIENLESSIHPKNIKINTLEINLQNISIQKEELEKNNPISNEVLNEIQEFLSFSQEKLLNIINECVDNKCRLEPVNMRAINKYDKIKARFDDLIDKHEIVVEERQSILDFIEKIEQEKKSTFINTFDGINDHFKSIFAKLSPDGEAKLELENSEDPFAGGVKILARPGGKKWCLTQSMSGGEKTLTVIALVLGIQLYIPSPYYILDEIDAALDDFNAGQVANMIKKLSEKSQFILITHRDVTMSKTDQLLGVSNVHGLTEIINLNIKEALEIIAES